MRLFLQKAHETFAWILQHKENYRLRNCERHEKPPVTELPSGVSRCVKCAGFMKWNLRMAPCFMANIKWNGAKVSAFVGSVEFFHLSFNLPQADNPVLPLISTQGTVAWFEAAWQLDKAERTFIFCLLISLSCVAIKIWKFVEWVWTTELFAEQQPVL